MVYPIINRLYLNNGLSIVLSEGDIVVFVGPNNAGKSQSLKDIYNNYSDTDKSLVIKNISFNNVATDEIQKAIEQYAILKDDMYCSYHFSVMKAFQKFVCQ